MHERKSSALYIPNFQYQLAQILMRVNGDKHSAMCCRYECYHHAGEYYSRIVAEEKHEYQRMEMQNIVSLSPFLVIQLQSDT